jgi:hypothetical protein
MNSTAIPSSPTGFVLTVTDIVNDQAGLTGKTSVPLPKTMISALIAPLTLTQAAPIIFIAKFSVEFSRK